MKRSFAQWATAVILFFFLYILKGIIDVNLGLRHGGGGILTAISTITIWSIVSAVFYSPLFKSNIDKQKFNAWLFASIIMLPCLFLFYANRPQTNNPANYSSQETPTDYIPNTPGQSGAIDIEKEIADLDEKFNKIKGKSKKERDYRDILGIVPWKKTINIASPSKEGLRPFTQSLGFKAYKFWGTKILPDNNLNILNSCAYNGKNLAIFHMGYPASYNQWGVIISNLPPIAAGKNAEGSIIIDGKVFPMKYKWENLQNPDALAIEFTNLDLEYDKLVARMMKGRTMRVKCPLLKISMTFNLAGFTSAYNEVLRGYNKKNSALKANPTQITPQKIMEKRQSAMQPEYPAREELQKIRTNLQELRRGDASKKSLNLAG